jgi:hypothetical protein
LTFDHGKLTGVGTHTTTKNADLGMGVAELVVVAIVFFVAREEAAYMPHEGTAEPHPNGVVVTTGDHS